MINPGATAEVTWNGAAWTTTDLSEACARQACEADPNWIESNGLPSECEVLHDLESPDYTVRVHVHDTCPAGVAEDECACGQDVCEVFFYEPSQGDYTVEASATFPEGAQIVLD